jgi:hypothetical protein
VGSEVVLKAGICTAQNYLLANQRVEWLLSPGGTGQFVEVAERDQLTVFRWPWDTPRKIDNSYAISSTSCVPVCLYRGTPDPNDDVQILKGDAWITVTSATEGTSHVTAYTPAISDWNLRRASATIYWVDAQWILPPPAVVEAGRPHVLTTTVMRRTDGAPLPGWLVRYHAAGGALLGYEGAGMVEVPTDASGRASVEVSPRDVGGGSATIGITIVRPPRAGADASPRIDVGQGAATITWTSGATVPITAPPPFSPTPATPRPNVTAPATPTSPFTPTPQPSLPSQAEGTPSPGDYTPPRDEPPPGRPQLEVRVQRTTPEQCAVGDHVSFDVTVTNRGAGTARGIKIRARFDRGLSHPRAKPNEFAVDYDDPGMRDLPPGESETIQLTFQVTAGGTQCHEVTVTADGATSVSQQGCVTARQAALEVTVTGPRSRTIGEIAPFRLTIKNVGDVAATEIVMVTRCGPALNPVGYDEANRPNHERLADGGIVTRIDRMEPGEVRTIPMEAQCLAQSNRACVGVVITAAGGVTTGGEACVEILPVLPPAAAGAPNLRLTISETPNPARSGGRQIIYVNVVNAGQQIERQVAVRVRFPPALTPDATQIQPQAEATIRGQEVFFAPIAELEPQGERRYVIPVAVGQTGEVQVRAAITASGLTTPITANSNVIQILPPSP